MSRKPTILRIALVSAWTSLAVSSATPNARALTLEWARQFGSTEYELPSGIAADLAGNSYTIGSVQPFSHIERSYLVKYDTAGNLLWSSQFDTALLNGVTVALNGVTVDSVGNSYVAGETTATPTTPRGDAFLAKCDPAGNLVWSRQIGSTNDNNPDFVADAGHGVGVDGAGNVYMSGTTNGNLAGTPVNIIGDLFLIKYDAAGNLLWKHQLVTSSGEGDDRVAVDSAGNAYISGDLYAGTGVFVTKFTPAGNVEWTRQLGSNGYSAGSATDGAGDVYISGWTYGSLGDPSAGGSDPFLAKYDSSGNLLWTRQIGTPGYDRSEGMSVSADALGNAYLAWRSNDSGGYVSKFDAAGNLIWSQQIGAITTSAGVASNGVNGFFVGGQVFGDIFGPSAGGADAFIAKWNLDVPEPTTLVLLVPPLITLVPIRRRALEGRR